MELFDKSASTYDSWYDTPMGRFVDETEKSIIHELLQPKPGETALDIGCGTGNYTFWLAKQGVHTTGIDLSEKMLETAERKRSPFAGQVSFLRGDAQYLPFADGVFDLAIAVLSLEFSPHPDAVLREAYRAVKSGGRLIAGAINQNSPWGEYYRRLASAKPGSVYASARFFTPDELLSLLHVPPSRVQSGLFLPPDTDNFSLEQALRAETEGRLQQSRYGGFFAVRWDKR